VGYELLVSWKGKSDCFDYSEKELITYADRIQRSSLFRFSMWAVGLVGQHEKLRDLGRLVLVHFAIVICNVEQLYQ
jgi:hypothetical protein